MAGRVENINKDVLRQCRRQIGLSISDVAKKVATIAIMEKGDQKPTFKQLNTLAELYKVPRWVFVSDHLPVKYQFKTAIPAFRQFVDGNADVFSDHKVRSLTARVERFRNMIIEFYEDMGETVPAFNPPVVGKSDMPDYVARQVRDWLKLSDNPHDFSGWREKLEKKGIFVFLTSKYKGWSHIDKELFRGVTIYHSRLPIIIINDSDANKAQSFTLFHELGHLLRKESTIDDWADHLNIIETWCNEFAGNVLMPTEQILTIVDTLNIENLDAVKSIAKKFQVSPYACLVRLSQLQIIDRNTYANFETKLKDEYRKFQKKLKESKGGPPRNRPKEILNQYGHIYTATVFQAYHNQEIGFHKLCRLFDLKTPSHALDLEGHI